MGEARRRQQIRRSWAATPVGRAHAWGRSRWADVRWGIEAGLWFACVYTLFAGATLIINTGSLGALRLAVLFYFGSGILAGAVVGLLKPLARRRAGSVLVGVVAGIPACLLVSPLVFGTWSAPGAWQSAALSGVVLGSMAGWIFWERPARGGAATTAQK